MSNRRFLLAIAIAALGCEAGVDMPLEGGDSEDNRYYPVEFVTPLYVDLENVSEEGVIPLGEATGGTVVIDFVRNQDSSWTGGFGIAKKTQVYDPSSCDSLDELPCPPVPPTNTELVPLTAFMSPYLDEEGSEALLKAIPGRCTRSLCPLAEYSTEAALFGRDLEFVEIVSGDEQDLFRIVFDTEAGAEYIISVLPTAPEAE